MAFELFAEANSVPEPTATAACIALSLILMGQAARRKAAH